MTSKKSSLSFSVFINAKTAELREYLKAVQFIATNKKLMLSSNVERHIKKLIVCIKALTKLQKNKWELIEEPTEEDSLALVTWRKQLLIEKSYIKLGIVGDLAELFPHVTRLYYRWEPYEPVAYRLTIPTLPYLYVKPKCLPLPQQLRELKQVMLKDGNVAWISPQILKKIQNFLASLQT